MTASAQDTFAASDSAFTYAILSHFPLRTIVLPFTRNAGTVNHFPFTLISIGWIAMTSLNAILLSSIIRQLFSGVALRSFYAARN